MNSHINFVNPYGNNNLIHANKYLQNIAAYCYGERSTEYVTNYPKKLSVNLTYGYLGLYSSLRFSDQINNSDFLYIMDHPPVVSDLKGKVFRLHAADQDLTPQVFCSSFLTATHKNSISLSIKAMQRSDGMSISVPLSNKKTIDYLNAHQQVSLYIKPSAVISRYLSSARTLLSKYFRSIQNSQAIFNQPPLIAVKEWEMALSPTGKVRHKSHRVQSIYLPFSRISSVYCPTSMIFVNYVLHSIPVYLSPAHPCYRICGSYIPPLSLGDAAEMIEHLSLRTLFSLDMHCELSEFLCNQCHL